MTEVTGGAEAGSELESKVLERTRALKVLSASNQMLLHATDESRLLHDVCEVAVEIGGYRMAWVGYIGHDEDKSIRPVAWAGQDAGYLEHINVSWGTGPTGQGPSGRSIRERKPIVARDILHDPEFAPWRGEAISRGYRSSIVFPLFDSDDAVFGGLAIYAERPDAFDVDETTLLAELAGDLAYGIEALRERQKRAEAEQRLRDKTADLEATYLESIFTMTRAAEYRDENTGAHVQRISYYCRDLARMLELDEEFVDTIFFASAMHDVGKIGIPDDVLLKPAALTPSEWQVMKEHASIGAKILGNSKSFHLQMGAEIALNHHERWDGTGYPSGKRGEAIPLAARIMSICDVYDALRSERPYKSAFDHLKSVEVISRGDGRTQPEHFDPAVLAAFRRDHQSFGDIFEAYTA